MFNKVIMVGNLTRDVELRYLNTGTAAATLGLASNRRYKKSDGMEVDDTCFVDVTLFGRTAEIANQYLKKGSKVLIEGRLHFETWTDQQGSKRSKHSIVAESMQMLGPKQQGEYGQNNYDSGYSNPQHTYQPPQQAQYQHNNTNASNMQGTNYPEIQVDDIDESIPF